MQILALEASTTSAKAMLYDTETGNFEEKIKAYGKMYEEEVLHNADTVFDCMVEIGKELAKGRDISIIALGGTWHSVLLCDRDMKPVTPVYPWTYTGAAQLCSELREDEKFVESYYHRTGCMVHATYPFFKLLLLKKQGYRLEDYYIMGQGSYNTYRLTGKRVVSRCMVSGAGLLNTHTREYDEESMKMAGVRAEQFSRLVESNHTELLSEEGAKLLGVKAKIPVVVANSDGGLNQIGVGAIRENVMTFSVGTSGAMRISTGKPVVPDKPSTWCYLSPKGWLCGAATAGCCNCIDWFVEHVACGQVNYSQLERGEEKILETPVFLPFLFGERCPGWDDEREGDSSVCGQSMTLPICTGQYNMEFYLICIIVTGFLQKWRASLCRLSFPEVFCIRVCGRRCVRIFSEKKWKLMNLNRVRLWGLLRWQEKLSEIFRTADFTSRQ